MNTLKQTLFLLLVLVFSGVSKTIAQSTGVYVGGHIRRERPGTIEKLRNSGFTYIILFNINVEPDGTLTTDGETVCKDGKYVFGNTQPNYVSDIKKLKQAPTTISRIEICIGGWGNESFSRIKELINSHGVGSSTILYKNFKALKNAIPEIDAVNNDDEHCYDVATAVKFHKMMYELGYKTTVAPYMNRSFWENLVSQLGDRCDRVLIQCYDGGAGNNPSDWHLGNRAVHAGRMNYQEGGVDACIAQMESWKKNNGVSGGFIWLYNDETWNLNQWATRMLRVFGTKKCDDNIASLYADSDYRGYSKSLGEGSYTQADLAMYGISAKDISSLKVTKGFKITLYENADFTGNSKSWTTDASFVGGDWNDKACSVRIEPNGKSGLSGNFKIMNRNSGKYLDLDNNKTDNNTAIVQFDDEGVDASQTWTFTEVMNGKGVYSICSYGNKNRGMDVADFSKENGAQVQLYDYLGNPHQQFILYDCGEGYYQLVARNSGKVVEIPQSSKGNGEWIKIYDNNGTHTQQWAVVENRYDEASAVTLYTDKDYKGKAVTLSEGEYNLSRMGLYNLKDNDMSSLKVTPGFKVTIYEDDNFNGKSKSYTASESFVGAEWNDKMSSLKVEAYHELQVKYHIGDGPEVTSEVSTEGSLTTLLGGEDNAMKVTQLSVIGILNDADINLLQKMAGREGTGSLKSLNLSEATFMSTGKKVPDNIFQNCKNLQKVDFSNMTEIGKWAFNNCALTEITIPASVTIIREEAFKNCSALKTLKFEAGTSEKELVLKEEAFFGCGIMDLANNGVLPSRIISIANRTFQGCGITKLTLPQNDKLTGVSRKLDFNGVQTDYMGALGYGVFFGCRNLTDLTIPANVTVINEVAFQSCNLQNVTFADATKITEIQNYAFTDNQNLAGIFADKDFVHLKTIGEGAFKDCFKLTDADFKNLTKNVTRIERETFRNCHDGLKTIDIHSGITFIGAGAFADNPYVTKIIVRSGTQIDAQSYVGDQGIFYRMKPNLVQVVFADKAETNYMVYRDNIKVGEEDKGPNAFMFLLTKTLDENATDYQVVAQRHADVLLQRTFKAGWNTLVLPFGARDNGKAVKCARIYQKALNAFEGDGFMIAAYRGLAKNDAQPDNSTFYFLQYADYDNDPLDEFEPLLVRMTQKDIDNAKGVYTFKDVELNYDADKSYTAEEAKNRMGKDEKGEYFTGNQDHELNDKFKNCSYKDFYFTGTLHLQQGNATEGSAFIAPGDYIIQNNTFVKCLEGKKYGLKGFRGYFKQLPSSKSSAKGNIGICLVDRNGVVSSIHQVDGVSLTSASVAPVAVYNLSGQQVGNSLSTLAKGVYIVKGKKFVKK